MMSPVIFEELQTAAAALLCGALITFVYDLLRIFRRVLSHGNFGIAVEDFIFWIWTSLWIFSVLYRENDGDLRIYTMAAMLFGMIGYHRVLSEPFVSVTGMILKKILKVIGFPINMVKINIINFGKKLKTIYKRCIMIRKQDHRQE